MKCLRLYDVDDISHFLFLITTQCSWATRPYDSGNWYQVVITVMFRSNWCSKCCIFINMPHISGMQYVTPGYAREWLIGSREYCWLPGHIWVAVNQWLIGSREYCCCRDTSEWRQINWNWRELNSQLHGMTDNSLVLSERLYTFISAIISGVTYELNIKKGNRVVDTMEKC